MAVWPSPSRRNYHHVSQRRGRPANFYRGEGALLVWILRRFDEHCRRLTEDDILFSNNWNVLVVNADTVRASEAEQRCLFLCFYREPFLSGDTITERWRERLVAIDELHFDVEKQHCYWFDYEGELTVPIHHGNAVRWQ